MRKLNWLLLLLIGSTSFISSCKKKEDKACTLDEAGFAGSYKVESVKYKATPSSPEVDGISALFDACELDDVTTFNTNHTYTYSDAGTTCSPSGDDSGTWSLNSGTLTVDGSPTPVKDFSCSNFSVSETDINVPGDKITVTFKRQ